MSTELPFEKLIAAKDREERGFRIAGSVDIRPDGTKLTQVWKWYDDGTSELIEETIERPKPLLFSRASDPNSWETDPCVTSSSV